MNGNRRTRATDIRDIAQLMTNKSRSLKNWKLYAFSYRRILFIYLFHFLPGEKLGGFVYISALWLLINILFLCAFACNEC